MFRYHKKKESEKKKCNKQKSQNLHIQYMYIICMYIYIYVFLASPIDQRTKELQTNQMLINQKNLHKKMNQISIFQFQPRNSRFYKCTFISLWLERQTNGQKNFRLDALKSEESSQKRNRTFMYITAEKLSFTVIFQTNGQSI